MCVFAYVCAYIYINIIIWNTFLMPNFTNRAMHIPREMRLEQRNSYRTTSYCIAIT